MSRRTIRLFVAGAAVSCLGVLLAPGGAIAGVPEPVAPAPPAVLDAPVPIISPTSGPPGTVITVTVPGCKGIAEAALTTEDDVLVVNDAEGDTVTLTVPESAPQGEIFVVAGCDVYSENDLNFTTFTVVAGAVVAQPHLTG
ncbi:MAG TPA: hypothetical protein VFZ17_01405 [Acidimicrobiia bacterium]|nr:hypothetical protein [Acidimicrobiia bacterium]